VPTRTSPTKTPANRPSPREGYAVPPVVFPLPICGRRPRAGGAVVGDLAHHDAERAASSIRDKAAAARAHGGGIHGGVHAAPETPSQVRRVAELRDPGATAAEEFGAKENDLTYRA
jgi:hypothetical protein